MKLIVTIYEETPERALDAIRALDADHDGVEVRAEKFRELDLHALRAATAKPVILTYRGSRVPDVAGALAAGIDYVDVEWREDAGIEVPERTVLSHHDYEGMRNVETIISAMRARGCAYTKLAATPRSFAENETLLSLLPGTVIGMGERGLYSRILAPFRGSELVFVAASALAAPGQLTLERALEIYGPLSSRARVRELGLGRGAMQAPAAPPAQVPRYARDDRNLRVFALAGNPAGHSLGPPLHNRLFREKGVPAAYTIASVESFAEVANAFLRGEPCGLSVTAPFKDDAFAFARAHGAEIGANAERARAVNTLVNLRGRIIADNTDVDGFAALLPRARKAAVVGAGGTARAAMVALEDAGIPATLFNRTASKGVALGELQRFDGDLVINTLPGDVVLPMPPCDTYIEAAYGGAPREVATRVRIGGLELLHAQAVRQHELFMRVFDGL